MTIEEFLRKIVEIDLTQAQHVFHDYEYACFYVYTLSYDQV